MLVLCIVDNDQTPLRAQCISSEAWNDAGVLLEGPGHHGVLPDTPCTCADSHPTKPEQGEVMLHVLRLMLREVLRGTLAGAGLEV
jgi:hypothetical protein